MTGRALSATDGAYDPAELGAECDRCPLRRDRIGGPVPPEVHAEAMATVIAEAPAAHEVREGAPLRGPSGWELNDAVRAAGFRRRALNYTNLLSCRLPRAGRELDSDLDAYLRRVRKAGEPSPVLCCRPRLERELREAGDAGRRWLLLGSAAAKAMLRTQKGIMALRGGVRKVMMDGGGDAVTAVATVHAAHVLGQRALRPVFWGDVARAFRAWTDTLRWDPFDVLYPVAPADLAAFLGDTSQDFWTFDIETTRAFARNIRPLEVRMRCLSVAKGDGSAAMVVPFLSVDGRTRFYAEGALSDFRRLLSAAFVDGRRWVGHNSRWFDRLHLEHAWGVAPRPHDDTIMLHRQAFPRLSHKLVVCGTTLTDVTEWKTAEDGEDTALVDEAEFAEDGEDGEEAEKMEERRAQKDEELWVRNATDSIVTARIVPPILGVIAARYPDGGRLPAAPYLTLDDLDRHGQDFCAGLHRAGVYVNQTYRERAETWLTWMADALLSEIRRKVQASEGPVVWGKDGGPFNPASHAHMVRLLYERWRLTPREYTDRGEYSASDKALRLHILDDHLPPDREDLLYLFRQWRKIRLKWLGTFVMPLAPERWAAFKRKPPELLPGFLSPDGRVRASWNAHGTRTLRYSADKPSMQIIPKEIRTIYVAEPGRLLFGADADQMHPRIVAALWGVVRLQEAFEKGWDPYGVVAEVVHARTGAYVHASGYDGHRKPVKGSSAMKLRNNAKTIFLAMLYGAHAETVHKTLAKVETPAGGLASSGVTYRMVQAACDAIHAGMPEIRQGWERAAAEAEANAAADPDGTPWLKDPIGGWRGDFPDGVRDGHGNIASDVINFKVLTAEAVLVHLREMELLDAIPWEKWGPGTGFVLQTHDSLNGEAPEAEAEAAAKVVADALTFTVPVLDGMRFTAEPAWGPTLREA